jgi:hypothetical protein
MLTDTVFDLERGGGLAWQQQNGGRVTSISRTTARKGNSLDNRRHHLVRLHHITPNSICRSTTVLTNPRRHVQLFYPCHARSRCYIGTLIAYS